MVRATLKDFSPVAPLLIRRRCELLQLSCRPSLPGHSGADWLYYQPNTTAERPHTESQHCEHEGNRPPSGGTFRSRPWSGSRPGSAATGSTGTTMVSWQGILHACLHICARL